MWTEYFFSLWQTFSVSVKKKDVGEYEKYYFKAYLIQDREKSLKAVLACSDSNGLSILRSHQSIAGLSRITGLLFMLSLCPFPFYKTLWLHLFW